MELEVPGELLAGGVNEIRSRLTGHDERDVGADAAGREDGVAGRVFFCGEHLLQLVELGRAEVAVLLQEVDEGVHEYCEFNEHATDSRLRHPVNV